MGLPASSNLLVLLLAVLMGQIHGYSYYRPSGVAPLSSDAYYSAMSDIDWSKRGGADNWISPAYGYSSMADHDWGWKKRSSGTATASEEDGEEDEGASDEADNSYAGYYKHYYYDPRAWQGYYYRPYSKPSSSSSKTASSSSSAPIALASRSFSSYRSPIRDDSFNYVGMADLDWGWKKRKRSGQMFQKRHIGSLGSAFRPRKPKV